MLDAETKRRIDTARDILVGKVPDPKSQVEQITIALIYKFMDDLDAESEELGGARRFFAGEFSRYGWAKLMRSGLGGYEVLNLYAEAINKMPENPGIPPLFRDIFKNAFLPYRDPETLRAFLKIIDEFTYDHSERLGDAFEYLLSVLGSQGDAGQFRTPRHIIDFIVAIIDPKKDETILDPACGTAGFLISSFKHIVKSNTDEQGHSTLTPDEKGRLAANFKGYDISPDMVRLSLVNLYLHGFADPHIFEYDTLTSEDRWNEYGDVILANPPFMSPKGGIRPHNRFSMKSKRSEVLFVDYMAEHLTPSGRAGIIVPEGVIFQSQTAHKQLRKMLVENYLVAVISLPSGVFQPYSGVKTSILILDKVLSRKADRIGFFKVENDGFDLGAQRRPIDKNDLPQITQGMEEYLNMDVPERKDREKESCESCPSMLKKLIKQGFALIETKAKIAANGEYSLSGERYREKGTPTSQFPFVPLSEVVEILDKQRKPITKHNRRPGPYPYYGATGVLDYVDGYLFDEPLVLVGEDGAKWGSRERSAFTVESKIWVNNHAHVLRPRRDRLIDRFLIEVLNEADLRPYITGVTVRKLNQAKLKSIEIPLPPLEVQKNIVAEIEGYQKVIDGARDVIDNYHPHIPIDPNWPIMELGELCTIVRGSSPRPKGSQRYYGGPVPRLMVADITRDGMSSTPQIDSLTEEGATKSRSMNKDDVIITVSGNPGLPTILAVDACIHDGFVGLREIRRDVNRRYLYWHLLAQHKAHGALSVGAVFNNLTTHQVKRFKIALPPLNTQQAIVAEIEAEQSLVAANRELIERFEKKIQAVIARVWSG